MSAQDDFINGDSITKAYVVQEPLIFGRIWMSVSFAKIAEAKTSPSSSGTDKGLPVKLDRESVRNVTLDSSLYIP